MKHKNKSKYESESSDDSASSSSSSDSDGRKSKKKHRRKSSSDDEYSTKKRGHSSESGHSEDDKYKKKVKVDDEKHRNHAEASRSHGRHSENRKESKHTHREKYRYDDTDSRRDKYDKEDNDRRRNDPREKSRLQEYDEDRHSHHHRRRERDSRERSRDREDRDRLNEKRKERSWNRRRRSRSRSFDHENAKWGKNDNSNSKGEKKGQDRQKPNFGLSGKLTEETNTYKGVVIKYSEPPEARKPRRRWRLYPFKGEKALQTLYIHRQSAYLIGRDRKIADLPVDHPSCSKQHAALQYRLVQFTREDGSVGKRVRPYIIDLESANGTFVNNKKIEPKKFVELLERDVIKFGFSSREYVLLHENSKDEAMDDDVKLEEDEGEVKVKKEEP